jgi:hypothetical protein
MPITYAVTLRALDGSEYTRLIDAFNSTAAVMVVRRLIPDDIIVRAIPFIPA